MKIEKDAEIISWIDLVRTLGAALMRRNHNLVRSSMPIYLTINMVAYGASSRSRSAPPRA
jgi:hypothetical protein